MGKLPADLELMRSQPDPMDGSRFEGNAVEPWRWQPVACSLDGSSMSERVQDWQRLAASAVGRETIPDGLRLTFPADSALALEVTRLAMAEQECCAFFDFTLQLTPHAVVLSVRAPEAGAGLLAGLFG